MKQIELIFFIALLFIISCHKNTGNNNGSNTESICDCNIEKSVLNMILNILEIKNLSEQLQRETGGKHGASAIIFPTDNDSIYTVNVGLNDSEHFETFYIFNVNKKTCEITVENQITEETYSLEEWQERYHRFINGEDKAFLGQVPHLDLKFAPLPFNFEKWTKWYNQQEYDKLPENSTFNYYKVEDNIVLKALLTANSLHQGLVPYLYFVLEQGEKYESYLLFSQFRDDEYPAYGTQDRFYDIINVKGDSIISTLYVGYLPEPNEDRKSFNIDKSLKIDVYDEVMIDWNHGPTPRDTLNIETYQIQEDGKIVKIE